jgi:hypothetical protein
MHKRDVTTWLKMGRRRSINVVNKVFRRQVELQPLSLFHFVFMSLPVFLSDFSMSFSLFVFLSHYLLSVFLCQWVFLSFYPSPSRVSPCLIYRCFSTFFIHGTLPWLEIYSGHSCWEPLNSFSISIFLRSCIDFKIKLFFIRRLFIVRRSCFFFGCR